MKKDWKEENEVYRLTIKGENWKGGNMGKWKLKNGKWITKIAEFVECKRIM